MKKILNLYKKYNEPVPRYTSYPPANHFKAIENYDDAIAAIIESNDLSPNNLSFYVHIPFCNQICYYCGCNSCTMKSESEVSDYVDTLIKEFELLKSKLNPNRKVSQIHFGGGTPNSISSHYLKRIVDAIRSSFSFIEIPEIAIECHPGFLDFNYLNELFEIGFNRFSLGIQDFDNSVLDNVYRKPSTLPVEELISHIRKNKPEALINLDFIYGLPGQTVESFSKSIEKATQTGVERIVTFSYAHVPWVNPTQKILEKKGLPTPEEKIQMFYATYQFMDSVGYRPIGLDHFVKEKDELYKAFQNTELHRNFQGYCTKRTTGQVIGLGVSSIAQLSQAYIQNKKSIKDYSEDITSGKLSYDKFYRLNESELIIREVINSLMCNKKLDFADISIKLDKNIFDYIRFDKLKIQEFVDDGIAEFDNDLLEVTDLGVLFIRNIAASLDPNFQVKENKYSRSV